MTHTLNTFTLQKDDPCMADSALVPSTFSFIERDAGAHLPWLASFWQVPLAEVY